jgi:hypothetical protein
MFNLSMRKLIRHLFDFEAMLFLWPGWRKQRGFVVSARRSSGADAVPADFIVKRRQT